MEPVAPERSERGFTLIEILVGMTVAIIALAGALSTYVAAARGTAIADQQAAATAIAREVMEQLRGEDVAALEAAYEDETDLAAVEQRGVAFTPAITVEASSVDADLVRVRVEVRWTEQGASAGAGRDHAIALEVLRTRQESL